MELKDVDLATADQKAEYERAKKEYEARLEPVKKEIEESEKPVRAMLHAKKWEQLDSKLRAAFETPEDKRTDDEKQLAKNAKDQLEPLWSEVVDALSTAERKKRAEVRKKLHEIELTEPDPPPAAYGVADSDKPAPATYILKVGDVKHKMWQVEPGVLTVLNSDNREIPQTSAGLR